YLARKYYDIAALRQPYVVDRSAAVDNQNFNKSIDYSKKVIGQYPKSKWVDDAYLLWARSLLGKEDPRQTVTMLQDFDLRYPKSRLQVQARRVRAESYYLAGDYERAQADYHFLGLNAGDDEERLAFLFREAECLEAAHAFDRELTLLRDAQSHEIRPVTPPPSAPAPASP